MSQIRLSGERRVRRSSVSDTAYNPRSHAPHPNLLPQEKELEDACSSLITHPSLIRRSARLKTRAMPNAEREEFEDGHRWPIGSARDAHSQKNDPYLSETSPVFLYRMCSKIPSSSSSE